MSGVAKAVKKVFKKVVKIVKKVWKPILAAVAIYFTAGLALSAMPATASFAASMPGFAGGGLLGTGIGGTAGTGIFTKIAAKFGLAALGKGGGLVGGALAKGTAAAELASSGISAAAIQAGATKAATSGLISQTTAASAALEGAAAHGTSLAAVEGAKGAAVAAGETAGAGATGEASLLSGGAAKGGMALSDKLLLASTGMKAVSGLLQPSARQIAEAQKRWKGAFYGDEGKGPTAASLIPTEQPSTEKASPSRPNLPSVSNQAPADVRASRAAMVSQPYRYGAGTSELIPSYMDDFATMQGGVA